MEQKVAPSVRQDAFPIPRWEFIALAAALMAVNALAVDIMLPALQQIGAALNVESENHRQYVITAYFAGLALALLAYGPISDQFGRRKPLLFGLGIYVLAAFAAAFAPSFETLLLLRFVQGIGAASTRVIAVSVVRDRFGGRQMAEIMSLIFMVFMVVPVVAPAMGQIVMLFSEWHMIFIVMAVSALAITLWAAIRLPETMHPEDRRPLSVMSIARGFRTVLTTRMSLWYTLASMTIFGALFGFINSAQQVYVGLYGLGVWFPAVFAAIAGMMSVSSFLNSRLVVKFGMRKLSHGALIGFLLVSAIWLVWSLTGPVPFPAFIVLFALAMFQFGWIGSNFNSISMEPLGHIAGTASSVQGFMQTLGGGMIGAAIGQSFDGTTVPLAIGFCSVASIGLVMVLIAEKGKLFRGQHDPKPAVAEVH
ncbi:MULTISPECIES: multidrug effflux MFS transporter [Aminobacter]|jgi:DHA1 family bicyclomycin/chloramphenicol resistance-like MFS transporter|uniref:Bcr/CflA family efflux transporter n=2 Tax=Aminobacter TaxID=31988 RepID=A0AAC8YRA6_AMIAI|nr:multidrug effflux MFS transporter [Aminobacter sp. MDW-2]AMS42833.1 major facilitator transporter [Aminobacter aminovorans]MBA8905912.1 DHA1 family bicyclomycin/chloramphenicol resistance-like MFS transporter [Aminobacter ciceronei]BBD37660.1 MFS transporter [Aminobacter sp. SS-2016]MBA9019691.1 DHA1 family bicyclomycin/chloramphenicol resistance-like MFS transporter [Aminobacter ciceronei]MBB3704682.1 DHA1 family bicyclomycin/chloramphenicol resistance-like MFS transporter [Aminobacter ami